MTITIMVADDHRMFLDLLKAFFELEPDLKIIAEASSGQEALDLLRTNNPDILILDIDMADVNGIDIARQSSRLYPKVKVIAVSGHSEKIYVEEMLKAGAVGYVDKSAGIGQLMIAVREVAAGGNFLSSEIAKIFVRRARTETVSVKPPVSVLGSREREVLSLVAHGKNSAEIAENMGIALATVKTHRRNIKQKLDIYSTGELTRYAIREGLISA